MNILLATSAAPVSGPFDMNEKRFPLGVGFLISALERAGHRVFFYDRFVQPRDYLADGVLQRERIDLVGISANTVCFRDTLRQCAGLQALRESGAWKGRITVGGPHAAILPHTVPPYVDHVVMGEGEEIILDIAEGRPAERVLRPPHIEDLDRLPMPAYHHFAALPYDLGVSAFPETPVFTMNTSRGCPFHCTFCSVKAVWGKTYRAFSAGRVVEDIEKLIRDYRVAGVFFREDHFTHSAERTRDFCELLLRKGVRTKWLCESRVHPLDLDLLPLMKRAGCEWIFFGCESGSDRLLQALKKGICAEHIRRALNECNRLGIKAFTTWLVNVPGETRQDRKATIRLIEETWPFKVAVGVFVGLPGSELRDEMERNGEVAVVDDLGMAYSRRYNHLVYHHYGIASRQYVRRDGRVGGAPLLFRMAHPFYSALRRLRWLTLRAWRRLHGKRQR